MHCLSGHNQCLKHSEQLLSARDQGSKSHSRLSRSHPIRKLQLGAGGNDPAGWLNTDIAPRGEGVYLDATQRYPFPDGSFQYIFSEHMIQAVPWEGGLAMLKECFRVLAPGGKLRIVAANLAKFSQLLNPDADAQRFIAAKLRLQGWRKTPVAGVYIFNLQMRDGGTQFLYDAPTLRKSLELAGFTQITEYPVNERTDPFFGRQKFVYAMKARTFGWSIAGNRWPLRRCVNLSRHPTPPTQRQRAVCDLSAEQFRLSPRRRSKC